VLSSWWLPKPCRIIVKNEFFLGKSCACLASPSVGAYSGENWGGVILLRHSRSGAFGKGSALLNERVEHVSVLPEEALSLLTVRAGGLYIDATFGAGGHTREIVALGGRVLAFDVDPSVRLRPGDEGAVALVHANFGDLALVLDERGITTVDGVLFDFGVSSMQFDLPERGFSLQHDGPLDMRMNPLSGRSAYELLMSAGEREIADLLFTFGEERASRRVARAVVAARASGCLPDRTLPFARLVAHAVRAHGYQRIHPATRTFQALRIAVNDELGALERGLQAALARTRPGARIVAISFHSLEDRIVKRVFASDARLTVLTRKPVLASDEECARNPRARSAKLRAAERREGVV
jgi:16S rRNA (cytosine1402-N4)-methyltransferase